MNKVSFCIICYDGDVYLLPRILSELSKQTVTPDELLVLVSGVPDENHLNIEVKNTQAKIHFFKDRMLPNKARNTIADIATGDVICLSDVDDIPHHQKIELVKKIFQNKEVDALVHNYIMSYGDFSDIENINNAVENIEKIIEDDGSRSTNILAPSRKGIHHAHITARKDVYKDVKGPEDMKFGEDGMFCRAILNSKYNMYYTDQKLIIYDTN